jgi:hypothetical protein
MNVVAFLVALVLFLGGLALMGYSFLAVGFEGPVFVGGILAVSAALAIPVHVLKRVDA